MKIRWLLLLSLLLLPLQGVWAASSEETSRSIPQQADLPLPELYELAAPSVVALEVRGGGDASAFFPVNGLGSGFIYDTEGHIITNNHVVEDAETISVTFFDGTFARAEVVATDDDSDIAVIKVEEVDPAILKPLPLGDSNALQIGEGVVAIGNPFGQNWTMTTGIVSAIGRTNQGQTGFSIAQMIQTDAAINPGNSGGPLLNMRGEAIGMNTLIFTETQSSSGVGFAVPINAVKRVAPDLITKGEYEYTWIGITGGDITLDTIELLELDPSVRGVLISRVSPDSPADVADLQGADDVVEVDGLSFEVGGDIITAVNGIPLESMSDLINFLAESTRPGDTIEVTILRDGKEANVLVKLEARPSRPR